MHVLDAAPWEQSRRVSQSGCNRWNGYHHHDDVNHDKQELDIKEHNPWALIQSERASESVIADKDKLFTLDLEKKKCLQGAVRMGL